MIDYAREANIELRSIFYEFDDILDAPLQFSPVMEAGEAPDSSIRAEGGGDPNNTNPNAKLKSTSGLIEKLKKIIDFLVQKVKEAISTLQMKIAKINGVGLDQFIKKANEARMKNGLNSVQIENNLYRGNVIGNVGTGICNVTNKVTEKVNIVFNGYVNNTDMPEDSLRVANQFNDEFEDKFWQEVITACQLQKVDGNSPDKIKEAIQTAFRGDKETVTIDENYANKCMKWLVDYKNIVKGCVDWFNHSKEVTKLIQQKQQAASQHPQTNNESNNAVVKFTTNCSKFTVFTTQIWILLTTLSAECMQNCKIVLMRAYNFEDVVASAKDKMQQKRNEARIKRESAKAAKAADNAKSDNGESNNSSDNNNDSDNNKGDFIDVELV